MKTRTIILVLVLAALFMQCKKEEVKPIGYLKINGTTYDLEHGIIDDEGTNNAITNRAYELRFQTSESNNSNAFFEITLKSPSTTRLQESTYVFNYSYDYSEYEFNYLSLGYGLQYDDSGVATAGTRIYDDSNTTGTCKVSKQDDNYLFEISGTFTSDGTTHNYELWFNESLVEGFLKK